MEKPEETFNPEEELRSENELLKLKLEIEHGMTVTDPSLNTVIENQWLKNVYDFEQQYRNARRIKVYDAIGRPRYRKTEELSPEEIPMELRRLTNAMEEKSIVLDLCCTYEDRVIYKFITEELFDHEMDDISVPGMIYHFMYEEFHPNHDYDLRKCATDFLENLLR